MRVHAPTGLGRRALDRVLCIGAAAHCRKHVATVRIVLVDVEVPSATALHAALAALPISGAVDWQLLAPKDLSPDQPVDVAITGTDAATEAALEWWPDADVVALLPDVDDTNAAVAALDAGATVCVQGSDVELIAAHVRAVARRRRLVN